ncbi:hypothetical protein D3C87_1364050 [compost metagenome]
MALGGDVEARAFARLDEALALQDQIGLVDGRWAHVLLTAERANGRDPVAGAQDPVSDELSDVTGNGLVEVRLVLNRHHPSLLNGWNSAYPSF